ncbi:hypothetical protein IV417_17485 [Alphaproteobacteria bacterium KMM 3653]|uniref:Uncharacterized protein n=1 Tax=Harenicola maris TaxID=2841044 RepID=A0AAP2CSA9_9RHOB|nr:hypothetical protein [Harenicola maris]
MNHEAKVIFLRQMMQSVLAETLKVRAAASPSPTSTKYAELMAKIARWQGQLAVFERNLNSQAGLVHKQGASSKARRDFSQRQSHASRLNNIASLRGQALGLADAIVELIEAMTGPDVALSNLIKSIDKLLEGAEDSDLSISPAGQQELTAVIQQADPGGSGGGQPYSPAPTMVTDVITLCIALFILLTRKKG